MSRGAQKPTRLRALEGGRSNSLPKPEEVNEPRPASVAPPMPRGELDSYARTTWQRLAPKLVRLGLLTEVDGDQFATLCSLRARIRHIRQALLARGPDMYGPLGFSTVDKELHAELRQCEILFAKAAADFGLTPRGRVGLAVNTDPDDEAGANLLT